MDKEEENKLLNNHYKTGYTLAEALLESDEFKSILKRTLSGLKNQYEVHGFSEGMADSIELAIKDIEHELK